jgi:hydrogenase maturation protein HypF
MGIESAQIQRRRILLQGIIQGVGLRPFVYREARQNGLSGLVLNNSTGVKIEVEGVPQKIDNFIQSLQDTPPVLARIDEIVVESIPIQGDTEFIIESSQLGKERQFMISPDTATCSECLKELFDPKDRRNHYPFINCTNCGPRFTIVQDTPYDRHKTTMASFNMCSECTIEYANPMDRRFHAQPNACPRCGPEIYLLNRDGSQNTQTNFEVILTAAQKLANGEILAIKGLGGYHIACDALNEQAVKVLRQRKYRESKPFALMVPDVATASIFCKLNLQEINLLQSHQCPIVLLSKRFHYTVSSEIAPNYNTFGVMLPYTPIHHLLLNAFSKIMGRNHRTVLVMTSGNMSEEPIAYSDEDARKRLFVIADSLVGHNRNIQTRCDDSIVKMTEAGVQILRRSRGYVPESLMMNFQFSLPLLACGGHLKNTFCLGKGHRAYLSHHIGDLENLETQNAFEEGIEQFQQLCDIQPEVIVYDLHPEYKSTRFALKSSIANKIGVQHHHAHIASVMAEHGLNESVIGIAADGTGYGSDGMLWGGEIMIADFVSFKRYAHFKYVPMPGGEKAIRQPWRMAAVYLHQAFGEAFLDLDIPFVRNINLRKWDIMSKMIVKKLNCPNTSGLGRLFDAVAAILMLRSDVDYEGQAAIELEMIATPCNESYFIEISKTDPVILDVAPMIRSIVKEIQNQVPISSISGKFHYTIAYFLAQQCQQIRRETELNSVVLSGGVFQNSLLLKLVFQFLITFDFQVYVNHKVPPNDGGLSLGQVAIAAAKLNN